MYHTNIKWVYNDSGEKSCWPGLVATVIKKTSYSSIRVYSLPNHISRKLAEYIIYAHKHTICIRLLTLALFVIAKEWVHPLCPAKNCGTFFPNSSHASKKGDCATPPFCFGSGKALWFPLTNQIQQKWHWPVLEAL